MSIAGLDVGTSGCKVVIYDLAGGIIDTARQAYKEEGTAGNRELDPQVVLDCVKACLKEVSARLEERIEALAIGTLGESIVCIDEQDNILCKSMVTGDKRGIEEIEDILAEVSRQEVMDITGLPVSEMFSLPKLLWINKNTSVFKNAKYIFLYEDYIGYYLTGIRKVSYSSASRTMAFDIKNKCWSQRLLKLAGISKEQLSDPVDSGTVLGKIRPEIAAELGLSPELKIVAGGHDQECAALGAGVIGPGLGEDGHGTCEVMNMMLPKLHRTDYILENQLTCVPGMIPDTYLTNIEITTCGILMNWFRDCIFSDIRKECEASGKDFYSYMDKCAAGVQTELLVLPQFGSSGNPDIDYNTKGLIWGLTIHTQPVEIYRAVKESMAFQIRMAYEVLEPLGIDLEKIIMTGGGSASLLTMQIRADVLGKTMMTMHDNEAGTLGCMIAAAKGLGYYASFSEGVARVIKIDKIIEPQKENKSYYEEKYKKYKKLYKLMHDFK